MSMTLILDAVGAGAVSAIGFAIGWAANTSQARRALTIAGQVIADKDERLATAASNLASLNRLNRDLNNELVGHRIRVSREKARRSAAVAKGNRTRSANFHAKRAAATAELASAK